MGDVLLYALVAAVVSGVLTSVLARPVARIAVALQALDRPDDRKLQPQPVPRLGGLALVGGLAIALVFSAALLRSLGQLPLARTEIVALAVGAFMVFLVGLIDDLVGVSTLDKFVVQAAAAFLIVRIGWSFDVLGLPGGVNLGLGLLGPVVSMVWIVGVTNAINLIDGLDGLAGGVVAIIAASFLAYAVLQGDPVAAVTMGGVMGACLGFLRHNWAPARIYLGDSGSLTLGFLLAVVSVRSSLKAPAAVAILVPILALGVPVIDTLLVMGVRFLERPKGPLGQRVLGMFHADRNHLHHLLLRLGRSRRGVVAWIYAAVFSFCLFALGTAWTRSPSVGLFLVATEILAVLAMRWLGMRAEARVLSERKRAEVREHYFPEGR